MSEQRAHVNDVEIAYETFGDPGDPALLLVMGLGMQLIHWDRKLCDMFVERGFFVIRFDNRDSGLSTQVDAPVPNLMRAMSGLRFAAPYLLEEMADDTFGLLEELGIEAAHVMGVSMGGMIAQTMAIRRPERVLSLTSIMSSTGERRAGRPKLRVWSVLFRRAPIGKDAYIEYFVRVFHMIGSKGFPVNDERIRELASASYERGHHPAGTGRQLGAIIASGDRTERLHEIRVPATVVHGKDDPLIPFRGGLATARAIPGAELIAIPGMGHDLPREVWPQLVEAVAGAARRGEPARAA